MIEFTYIGFTQSATATVNNVYTAVYLSLRLLSSSLALVFSSDDSALLHMVEIITFSGKLLSAGQNIFVEAAIYLFLYLYSQRLALLILFSFS